MEFENRIIDLCFAQEYWVFGGYVRDVMVRGLKVYQDIDILVPRSRHTSVDYFINTLSALYPVEVLQSKDFSESTYAVMSPRLQKNIKILVNKSLILDLCLYDGEMAQWCNDQTVDLSCNLFFTSRSIPLGLRYIPQKYKYVAAPTRKLISMTRAGFFEVIFEAALVKDIEHSDSRMKKEFQKVSRVLERTRKMVVNDWYLLSNALTPESRQIVNMVATVEDRTSIYSRLDEIHDIQDENRVDATGLPDNLKDQVRKNLF